MKRILFLLGAFLTLSTVAKAEQYWVADPRPPRFCLQNFNAYGPIYASNVEVRSELIAGFFQAIPKCEAVHLQEVWNEPQINIFERYLKKQYNISSPNRQAKIGLMSLFMGDVKGIETRDFQVNNEGGVLDTVRSALNVKKAFHVAKTNFYGIDEDFYFVNTHLHPSSVVVRITQVLDLLRWRLERQDSKLLLSGDFNADVDSLERKLVMLTLGVRDSMADFLGGSYPLWYCTYCAGNPLGWMLSDHTFDYIFYSNIGAASTTLKVTDGKVNMRGTPRRPWSDHFGVRVEFSVDPEVTPPEAKILENRRSHALKTLEAAQTLLQKQEGPEFKPYAAMLGEMTRQLKSRQGVFNRYFESFR